MTKFWIKALINKFLKARAPWLPGANAGTVVNGVTFCSTSPSKIVPDIPQYPVNVITRGNDSSDQALLDTVTVGRCILNVFVEWTAESLFVAAKAKQDLDGHYAIYDRQLRKVPAHHSTSVPIETVEALARQYVGELMRNIGFLRRFTRDDIDVAGLTIDFANTIGCGPALSRVLNARA